MCQKKSTYSLKDEFLPYIKRMEESAEKTYITERILGQIVWYDKKSGNNQKKYKRTMLASIILSALIPITTITIDFVVAPWIKILIATISSTVTLLSAVCALYGFRELWVQYRTNCELLKSELHQFFTNSCEFNSSDMRQNFLILVEKSEGLLTREFKAWASTTSCTDNVKGNQLSIGS